VFESADCFSVSHKNLSSHFRQPVLGFFENIDFLEFHEMVLRSQGLNHVGWTLQEKLMLMLYVEKAKKSLQNSLSLGWKEPRTALFLDFG